MKSFAIVAAAAVLTLFAAGAAQALPKVGDPAPDFRTFTFQDKVVTLKDLKGKVVLINFWATWCGPCKTELPLLDAYYKLRKANGFEAVAVTTEDSVPVENLGRLARAMTMPLAYRFKGAPYTTTNAVPMSVVIDRQGIVRYAATGSFTLERLDAVVLPLLKEPAPNEAPAATTAKVAAR